MLIIRPNEYLTLIAADANEMLDLKGSGIHWHMETEEMSRFIIDIL